MDTANCNSSQTVDESNPTCFLVTEQCDIPAGENGPELSPIAPTDCVFAAPLAEGAQGEIVAQGETGINQGF